MKYYKFNSQVYAFESDGSQDDFISPQMILMSEQEVDKHINPQNYLTDEQKYQQYLAKLTPLSRRQFKLMLLNNNLFTEMSTAISNIPDPMEQARADIEYSESIEFVRTSEGVKYLLNLLGLSEDQINELWEKALAL